MERNITKRLSIWATFVGVLLLIPFLLMRFHIKLYDPGSGYEEMNWGLGDFVFAGILLFGAGLAYILATRNMGARSHRVLVGIVVFIVLAVLWVGAATGFEGI